MCLVLYNVDMNIKDSWSKFFSYFSIFLFLFLFLFLLKKVEADFLDKKIDFSGTIGDFLGSYPFGSLTLGSDGKFYGMTNNGGVNDVGVIFQWDPNTNTYVDKYDFVSITGSAPADNNSLVLGSDGKFYGMTSGGGANGSGVIFQWDPNTNTYIDKVDFTNDTGDFIGAHPHGSLTLGSDGKFYGVTYVGGTHGSGVIFQWDPNTNTYVVKVDFTDVNPDFWGSYTYDSLTLGSDNKFYGITSSGGLGGLTVSDAGVIFQWDPNTNTYIDKVHLECLSTGCLSQGSLTLGSDNKFYGMTNVGGLNDKGVIFQWDPNTNTYVVKINFSGVVGDFIGAYPRGSLTLGSDGKFYGMTSGGGANGSGVIFQWDPNTNTYIDKVDMDYSTTGSPPLGSLTLGSNNKFYGKAGGGQNNFGTIFTFNPVIQPIISSDSVSGITVSTATLHGSITNTGGEINTGTNHGFKYGTNSSLIGATTVALGEYSDIISDFTTNLSGLTCNTTYYYSAYGSNSIGTSSYDIQSFTTDVCVIIQPIISSDSVSGITVSTATLHGSITNTGGEINTGTNHGFKYGTNSSLIGATTVALGEYSDIISDFTTNLSGLTCNTTYYYSAYGSNSIGTSSYDIQSFTTDVCHVVTGGGGGSFSGVLAGVYPKPQILIIPTNKPQILTVPTNNLLVCSIINTLKKDNRGAEVSCLQRILKVFIDGIFGSQTRAAVMNFQKNKNLKSDGIVGPKTINFLMIIK